MSAWYRYDVKAVLARGPTTATLRLVLVDARGEDWDDEEKEIETAFPDPDVRLVREPSEESRGTTVGEGAWPGSLADRVFEYVGRLDLPTLKYLDGALTTHTSAASYLEYTDTVPLEKRSHPEGIVSPAVFSRVAKLMRERGISVRDALTEVRGSETKSSAP